ncbi:MAG: hypothetical protein KBG20_14645 [Caldilineaceae bacterium]|nr:hypothetical protein [Caldilineaceae bacterium]MBP8108385.1 hypothetical protein [Caldilineaceae bacterium]MBP8123310.1 hypothetical protein [Caldilineaceae bacterium]MBP9073542.1 hypothetical protein [Caldilineaceae bacterium]
MQYHITASVDPTKSELTAKAVLHLEEAPLTDELTLRINPNLQVACVRFRGIECGFSQTEAGRVVINLPAVVATVQPSLEVEYAGELAQYDAAGEQMRAFINEDFFWLRDDQLWFPMLASQQAEMLPVPPGRCIVQMAVPAGWEVAASASLIDDGTEGEWRCYRWDTQRAYSGLSVVGGTLQRHNDGKCTFLWLTPRLDLAQSVLDALGFYEEILGPCPHADLTVVMGPSFLPGGYADRGLIHVGENKLTVRTLAHELVHQWWGRGVWAQGHGDRWLTEGLAGYLSLHYAESRGESVLDETLETYREAYGQAVATWGDKPLAEVNSEDYERTGLVSALIYKKGAWLHWMLHSLLGDRYFQALQAICAEYGGKPITTTQYIAELVAICEDQSEAIQIWAQQWLYAPGLPGLTIQIDKSNASPDRE